MDVFSLIIGFGIGFFTGLMLKWIKRFVSFVKQEQTPNPYANVNKGESK